MSDTKHTPTPTENAIPAMIKALKLLIYLGEQYVPINRTIAQGYIVDAKAALALAEGQ